MSELGPYCALGSSVTWALGSSGYSRISRDHSPFAVNFSRGLIALPLFLIATLVMEGGWAGAWALYSEVHWWHLGWLSLAVFASYGLGDTVFIWSAKEIGVPGALAVASTYPIITALIGFFFHGQSLSYLQVCGLVLTVVGVVTVILATSRFDDSPIASTRNIRKGVLLALVAALMWTLNSYAVAQGGQGISTTAGNTLRMILAMVLSYGFGRVFAPRLPAFLPATTLTRWSWLFVLEGFMGANLYLYGLSHSPLAVGAALASLAPVISVPVAWAMGTEKFSVLKTLAVCMVVTGIWMLLALG